MTAPLPRTARDVFTLSPRNWLIYNATIEFVRLTGLWRYPIEASGDLETMRLRDKIYWLYKSQYPVASALKGAGLETFFANQASHRWELPSGFQPAAELTLTAVGDLMDHPYLPRSGRSLYERVSNLIFDADVAMANLECVIYPHGSGEFVISPTSGPPLYYTHEAFNAAKGMSGRTFDVMVAANNHSLDYGEAGVIATLASLRREGIIGSGMNESEAASRTAPVIERQGLRLAILSHTFGLNAKKPPADKPWIVNRTNLNDALDAVDFSTIAAQLDSCRDQMVDLVIAHLHWGMEHEYYPRPEQLQVARHLAELGCDVVIGHHPHVVQPVEYYRTRRDPDRVVPIYYSLGNLLTPFSHWAFRRSAVARLTAVRGLTRDGVSRTYFKGAHAVHVDLELDHSRRRLALVPASE
jgi:hypothetical protein